MIATAVCRSFTAVYHEWNSVQGPPSCDLYQPVVANVGVDTALNELILRVPFHVVVDVRTVPCLAPE